MQKRKTKTDLLYWFDSELGCNIMLLSEQYQRHSQQWFTYPFGTLAIWILSLVKVPVLVTGSCNDFVWMRSGSLTFISCYLSPSQPIADFFWMIDSLGDEIRKITDGIIVCHSDKNRKKADKDVQEENKKKIKEEASK
ncbi:hypothetical protein J6590_084595 [Homalodisca vitripennis]|nr:hypothetical protein J6590_084595 [Homalodisca vitripennis]